MIDLDKKKKKEDREVEMVELFRLDGEVYKVPARPGANIALRYLRNIRMYGEDLAASMLLEDMLGNEGYEALMNYPDLTMDDLQQVLLVAQKTVMGQVENVGDKAGKAKKN